MYGLVNQAVQEMVVNGHGQETWEKIRSEAGVDDVFIAMDQYPDEDTVKLVMAASKVLGAAPGDILKGFGQYWVGFTGRTYGSLFEMSGRTFVEFVKNLDNLHSRVGQLMPELKPPSFTVSDETDDSFKLHYYSSRPGLYPMLFGLIKGLGERFNTEVEAEHLRGAEQGLDHDEFLVRYRPR